MNLIMESSTNPSLFSILFGVVCIAPWIMLIVSAMRDKEPGRRQQGYNEPPMMRDERAAYSVNHDKLRKLEKASRL